MAEAFRKSLALVWPGLAIVVLAAGLMLGVHWCSTQELRHWLQTISPLSLEVGFILLALAVFLNCNRLWIEFKKIPNLTWTLVALIALLSFWLSHWVAPRTHRIYYDEDIYQNIALNIAYNNRAAMVNDGSWEFGEFKARRNEYNKQPNGLPVLLSIAYRLFGVSEAVAHNLVNLLFPVAVGLVFLCGVWLFNSATAGVFAATIYALIPENSLWFSTTAVEPATAVFTLLAVASALFFIKSRSTPSLFLAAVALALAVQFRPEVILIAGLIFLIILVEASGEYKKCRIYWLAALFVALIFCHILHLYAVRGESWGSGGAKFASEHFWHNFGTNTRYYLNGDRFPILFTALALPGLILAGIKNHKVVALYLVTWFLLAWGVFLFFYAGSYEYGADVRFSLMSMAPLALSGGIGASCLLRVLQKYAPAPGLFVIVSMLIINLLAYLPLIRSTMQESWQSRDDHQAAQYFSDLVPPDGVVMTHNPGMFHVWGINAAQMSLFKEDPNYIRQVLGPKFRDKLFLHWNFWCNVNDPVQSGFARYIMDNYKTSQLAEKIVRNKRYALYRIGERIN
jgi:4-amino-4-deoxy-L-arabinose transferase-like glycosyltransferase